MVSMIGKIWGFLGGSTDSSPRVSAPIKHIERIPYKDLNSYTRLQMALDVVAGLDRFWKSENGGYVLDTQGLDDATVKRVKATLGRALVVLPKDTGQIIVVDKKWVPILEDMYATVRDKFNKEDDVISPSFQTLVHTYNSPTTLFRDVSNFHKEAEKAKAQDSERMGQERAKEIAEAMAARAPKLPDPVVLEAITSIVGVADTALATGNWSATLKENKQGKEEYEILYATSRSPWLLNDDGTASLDLSPYFREDRKKIQDMAETLAVLVKDYPQYAKAHAKEIASFKEALKAVGVETLPSVYDEILTHSPQRTFDQADDLVKTINKFPEDLDYDNTTRGMRAREQAIGMWRMLEELTQDHPEFAAKNTTLKKALVKALPKLDKMMASFEDAVDTLGQWSPKDSLADVVVNAEPVDWTPERKKYLLDKRIDTAAALLADLKRYYPDYVEHFRERFKALEEKMAKHGWNKPEESIVKSNQKISPDTLMKHVAEGIKTINHYGFKQNLEKIDRVQKALQSLGLPSTLDPDKKLLTLTSHRSKAVLIRTHRRAQELARAFLGEVINGQSLTELSAKAALFFSENDLTPKALDGAVIVPQEASVPPVRTGNTKTSAASVKIDIKAIEGDVISVSKVVKFQHMEDDAKQGIYAHLVDHGAQWQRVEYEYIDEETKEAGAPMSALRLTDYKGTPEQRKAMTKALAGAGLVVAVEGEKIEVRGWQLKLIGDAVKETIPNSNIPADSELSKRLDVLTELFNRTPSKILVPEDTFNKLADPPPKSEDMGAKKADLNLESPEEAIKPKSLDVASEKEIAELDWQKITGFGDHARYGIVIATRKIIDKLEQAGFTLDKGAFFTGIVSLTPESEEKLTALLKKHDPKKLAAIEERDQRIYSTPYELFEDGRSAQNLSRTSEKTGEYVQAPPVADLLIGPAGDESYSKASDVVRRMEKAGIRASLGTRIIQDSNAIVVSIYGDKAREWLAARKKNLDLTAGGVAQSLDGKHQQPMSAEEVKKRAVAERPTNVGPLSVKPVEPEKNTAQPAPAAAPKEEKAPAVAAQDAAPPANVPSEEMLEEIAKLEWQLDGNIYSLPLGSLEKFQENPENAEKIGYCARALFNLSKVKGGEEILSSLQAETKDDGQKLAFWRISPDHKAAFEAFRKKYGQDVAPEQAAAPPKKEKTVIDRSGSNPRARGSAPKPAPV